MTAIACQMRGIEKAFGHNIVLRGVDLTFPAGKVSVLMGANGAGKSTLVKILAGLHAADAGTMELAGAPHAPVDAAQAIAAGVVTVHQSIDDGVIPDLDVATNLMLDRLTEQGAGFFVNDRRLRREAREVAASMGLNVDVRARVGDLGLADRQMIAIARAMARAPKVLILDEPTSSLSATEAERLFALIDRLRESGVAILYISHRMSDIRRLADRIICLRDGAVSGEFEDAPLDYEGAVTAMLGHGMTEVDLSPTSRGAPVLTLRQVHLRSGAEPFDLTAHAGEVIAITGLLGSGKSRLAEAIYGITPLVVGEMTLDNAPFRPTSPEDAVAQGVHFAPKDRANTAVIPDFDISGNMTVPFLKSFTRLGLLRDGRQRAEAEAMISDIGVVCQGTRDGIGTLSGGNQQKVMIGRWLLRDCRVLVLDEPFQGVDIGARRDIGHHIRATAEGRATLVLVAELDEALEVADRILVLHEARLAGEHFSPDIDLGLLIAQVSGEAQTPEVAHG